MPEKRLKWDKNKPFKGVVELKSGTMICFHDSVTIPAGTYYIEYEPKKQTPKK